MVVLSFETTKRRWILGGLSVLVTMLLASGSCDLDTETTLCADGLRCPTGWQCTADGSDCISGTCGNGILDPGEICDDGNIRDGDGCSRDCTSGPGCGNGIVDPGEVCDDGNNRSGDGCSADCLSDETCGNGYRDIGEQCDDGNSIDGDGCSSDCMYDLCGDGKLDTGEVCDDGNNVSGDGCSADCLSLEICGNGYLDVREECDVGGIDVMSCNADCTLAVCGDGYHNPKHINPETGRPEECDEGGNTATCDADCTFAICGDGSVNPAAGEQCDDGNTVSGDGCSASCQLE